MGRGTRFGLGVVVVLAVALVGSPKGGRYVPTLQAQSGAPSDVTFTKDIAPILQRSCQNCHRPDGVAPMSLVTYEDVRPWARSIKQRTAIGPHRGVMPPWYIEKNVGIQQYKNDPSLSDEEIATIVKWVDSGAPQGNAADMPPMPKEEDITTWRIGTPDIVVRYPDFKMPAAGPDLYGSLTTSFNLKEDRYIKAIESKAIEVLAEMKPGRQLYTNVEFYAGIVMDRCGVPRELFTPTFAASRVIGWCAHILEQAADNRLIRPSAQYVGPPPPQPVPPIA